MGDQLTTSAEALRLFFTDDVYLISTDELIVSPAQPAVIAKTEMPVAEPMAATESIAKKGEVPVTEPVAVVLPDIAVVKENIPPAEPVSSPDIAIVKENVPPAEPAKTVETAIKTAPVVFRYMGKNQKNILILVHDEQYDVSTERGRELLRNIVKALQLTANDFALLNYSAYKSAGFEELSSFFSSKLVLAFGVDPSQLGLNDQPKNILNMQGTVQLIFSENLDQLAEDQNGKKTLWGSLKKLSI